MKSHLLLFLVVIAFAIHQDTAHAQTLTNPGGLRGGPTGHRQPFGDQGRRVRVAPARGPARGVQRSPLREAGVTADVDTVVVDVDYRPPEAALSELHAARAARAAEQQRADRAEQIALALVALFAPCETCDEPRCQAVREARDLLRDRRGLRDATAHVLVGVGDALGVGQTLRSIARAPGRPLRVPAGVVAALERVGDALVQATRSSVGGRP